MTWKHLALILGLVCGYQQWRSCTRSSPGAPATVAATVCPPPASPADHDRVARTDRPQADTTPDEEAPPAPTGPSINGFKLPAWTLYFAPQPGEDLASYRDRMLPIAEAVLAPHRARVARSRDELTATAKLDAHQRAELDAAVQEAATAIEDRVLSSVLSGDLTPATFKPMTGVTLARDALDTVVKANQRFMASLRDDQRATLAQHPFDFGDYLLFSAHWEDALGVVR